MKKERTIKVPRNVEAGAGVTCMTASGHLRSPEAMHMKQRSKKIAHKNDRRAKDARKHFDREEW